jgi:hypothetical protein
VKKTFEVKLQRECIDGAKIFVKADDESDADNIVDGWLQNCVDLFDWQPKAVNDMYITHIEEVKDANVQSS